MFSKKPTLLEKLKPAKETPDIPSLFITACAGGAKTTTLVEGVKHLLGIQTTIDPTPEQAEIWKSLAKSRGVAETFCFTSMGVEITAELRRRVPPQCDVMTTHAMGYKAIRRQYPNTTLLGDKCETLIGRVLGRTPEELKRTLPDMFFTTRKLIDLYRMTLTGYNMGQRKLNLAYDDRFKEDMDNLAHHFDIDVPELDCYQTAYHVLDEMRNYTDGKPIDHVDQIWLPIIKDLHMMRYDLLVADEAQDFNRCQHEMLFRCGKRLAVCGDPDQAIYGFAGSDIESMMRIKTPTRSTGRSPLAKFHSMGRVWEDFTLSWTMRCPHFIVQEARQWSNLIQARPGAPLGERPITVSQHLFRDEVKAGDMVICRLNAPLFGECMHTLKRGIKSRILGREVLHKIRALVKKARATTVTQLHLFMRQWVENQIGKIESETRVRIEARPDREEALESRGAAAKERVRDVGTCVIDLAMNCKGIAELYEVIETLSNVEEGKSFDGVTYGTIHKIKGLEADDVWFLMPDGAECPSKRATGWRFNQEKNLRYIGITRAKKRLRYVR